MNEEIFNRAHLGDQAWSARASSPDIQTLMRSLVAALNTELEHPGEPTKLDGTTLPDYENPRSLEKLEQGHGGQRGPCTEQPAAVPEEAGVESLGAEPPFPVPPRPDPVITGSRKRARLYNTWAYRVACREAKRTGALRPVRAGERWKRRLPKVC